MSKISKEFYDNPALTHGHNLLGKVLVRNTSLGTIKGVITDIELYPAFHDGVHHGNKRTPRTEIMWQSGGYLYIYLIYGMWHQFGVTMNKEEIPDFVMYRGVYPIQGLDIILSQWKKGEDPFRVTQSSGLLARSFCLDKTHYGLNFSGEEIYIEDIGIQFQANLIQRLPRVGISKQYIGWDLPLRYKVNLKNKDNQAILRNLT